MSKQNAFPINADMELAKELRESDLQVDVCVEALLKAVVDMAGAIGVEVTWAIRSIDKDKIVDKAALTKALGRLATSGGALLIGGEINPMNSVQNPMKILKDKQGEK